MTRRRRRTLTVAAVLAGAAALLSLLAIGEVAGFLSLAPALLLGAVLALGRFPGERVLTAAVRRALRPRRGLAGRRSRSRAAAVLPRGGRLIGARMAGRAPPHWIGAPA